MKELQLADLQRGTVLVAGLGVSGRSVASVLGQRDIRVVTVDEHSEAADLHSFDDIDWSQTVAVMASPVFSPRTPFILEAQRRFIPVVSEVELAWQLRVDAERTGRPAGWIGITGTNGKTSTTEMTSAMLTSAGLVSPAVGNIGIPVSGAAVDANNDVLCVELSSFQLHFTDSLALDCAAITNIADDHLDWHGGFANYMADKSKVFHSVQRALVYNADDERVSSLALQASIAPGCQRIGCTLNQPKSGQIGIDDGWITDASGLAGGDERHPRHLARVSEFRHLSEPDGTIYPHLLSDALIALALALGYGADCEHALDGLRSFAPGGHRIQTVATEHTADGGTIRFVDDSKATNAHAANASLSSFPAHSVVWIAGGLAKGSRFEQLVAARAGNIKAAVIIGLDQEPMRLAFAASAPQIPVTYIEPVDHAAEGAGDGPADIGTVMDRAVEAAGLYAEPGDVVLMAPACASMDQFVSYADRGRQFADAAQRWVGRHGQR